MTDVEAQYDEDTQEALGPSLALPPLYVLRAAERCPKCGTALHVYTLGCTSFHDADDSRPVDIFHFLRHIESVPPDVLTLLKAKCPTYYLDQEEANGTSYLMNHCRCCGARLDDDFLHGDVGAAFFPDTPDGYRAFKLFTLPVDEPVPIVTSYCVGGGEYLDFDEVKPWTAL